MNKQLLISFKIKYLWWFVLYCQNTHVNSENGFSRTSDLLFGHRTSLVTLPTTEVIREPPFNFGRNKNEPSSQNNKWGITYLSREDARRLIMASGEQPRVSSASPRRIEKTSSRKTDFHPKTEPSQSVQEQRKRLSGTTSSSISGGVLTRRTPVALPFTTSSVHPKKISTSTQTQETPRNHGEEKNHKKTSIKFPKGKLRNPATEESSRPTNRQSAEVSSPFSSTEGLEVISSTSDDRMALLEGRPRERPQLIFLADDPEAASRIPDLLTTLYDVGPTTKRIKPGFYGLKSGIITERNQDEIEDYTEDPKTIQLTPVIPSERDDDAEQRHLDQTFGHQSYFPSRYRPSFNDHRRKNSIGSNFKDKLPRPASKSHLKSLTRVTNIEAECQDDFMRIHVRFNGSFDGLVYSSGYSHDLDCVYINGSGRTAYEFFIKLNRCGTLGSNQLEDPRQPIHKNVMWNTLTVQYNPLIEEEWDEHFKVTCEYGLEIWKTVTFPFLDVEVQTGNPMLFTLRPPECHMEIRQGFGPDGPRVSSPVRVGDPLTLVIYMRSQYDGFDIVISDCYAHNGGTKTILLIDSYGCPVDDKLISHFEGQSLRDGTFETQVFAFMKTFRFTGSPALYIECGVRMCHGDCPSQQCHWRSSRKGQRKNRRSVPDDEVLAVTDSPKGNMSESLHLFQALQVIRDDEDPRFGSLLTRSVNDNGEDFCFKSNHFSIGAGVIASLLSLLMSSCFILCLRLRRIRKRSNDPEPPKELPARHTYRSEYVPPNKRRLE